MDTGLLLEKLILSILLFVVSLVIWMLNIQQRNNRKL